MMDNYSLYVHTNKVNGKKYVGITNNIDERWRHNGIAYKPYSGDNPRPFWNAICKYGFDSFEHEVVLSGLTFKEACELEKRYISDLGTRDRSKGYNVAEGGNGGKIYKEHPRGMLGKHHSQEKRDKQRELLQKNKDAGLMAWKHGHPRGMLGKHHTPEHNAMMSEKMKGRAISEETRRKMAEAAKGRKKSEEELRKISAANKGKRMGAENYCSRPVVYILNGVEHHCECRRQACEDLKIGTTLFYMLVESGLPYVPRGRSKNVYARLAGLVIRYA